MNNNQNLVLIGDKQYELSSPTSNEYKKLMIQSFGDEYINKEEVKLNVTLNSNSVDGYFIELSTNITNPFKVEVYDEKEKLIYNTELTSGMHSKLNKKYYTKWKTKLFVDGLSFEHEFNLENSRVFIVFESSSLGDTLAWIPYCEEFRKKHNCEVVVSTFLNHLFIKKYPNLILITGANTIYTYKANEAISSTAQKFNDANEYYDSFNTAIQLKDSTISCYHKSKLVPGVERMPFPSLLKPLEGLAIDLGGTIGSLGSQDYRTVFFSHNDKVGIAPVICYESVYSDYVAQYVRNGANLIFIITNDGWWENTPGHRQHLAYARLRAIETRREIARCANTGISCFITPFGEIEQATTYWEKASIIKHMTPQTIQTWFVTFGDLISYSSSLLAILLIAWSQILRFKKS